MDIRDLAEELQRQIIRKFEKRKVHSLFKDNIWVADLADMKLISKFHEGFRFLLCVIDIIDNMHGLFIKKIKKELQLLMLFKKF